MNEVSDQDHVEYWMLHKILTKFFHTLILNVYNVPNWSSIGLIFTPHFGWCTESWKVFNCIRSIKQAAALILWLDFVLFKHALPETSEFAGFKIVRNF